MAFRCGTEFKRSASVTAEAEETLRSLEEKAMQLRWQADQLKLAVAKCRERHSIEGLAEMVAFSFNPQQYTPRYGGGGQLPPGDYIGVIATTKNQDVIKNGQVTGGYLALALTPVEGPLKGQQQIDRLNLFNSSAKTVQIANEQLTAYCVVTGTQAIQADTDELCNKPFKFTIGWQPGQEPNEANPNGGYTEVKGIYGMDGRKAEDIVKGSAGAGGGAPPAQQQHYAPPPQQQQAPPPQQQQYQVDPGAPPSQQQQQAPQGGPAPGAADGWPAGGAPAPAAAGAAPGAAGGWPSGGQQASGWGNR